MPARRHPKSVLPPKKKKAPVQVIGPLTGPAPDLMLSTEAAGHVRLTISGLQERTATAEDPTRGRNGTRDPIACLRYGRMLRYRRQDLDAWIARQQTGGPAKVAKAGAR